MCVNEEAAAVKGAAQRRSARHPQRPISKRRKSACRPTVENPMRLQAMIEFSSWTQPPHHFDIVTLRAGAPRVDSISQHGARYLDRNAPVDLVKPYLQRRVHSRRPI
jgi:hypothetical protein